MTYTFVQKFGSLPMKTKLIIAAAGIATFGMASQQSNSHPGAFAPAGGYYGNLAPTPGAFTPTAGHYGNWAPTPSPSLPLPSIWPAPPSNAAMENIINGD